MTERCRKCGSARRLKRKTKMPQGKKIISENRFRRSSEILLLWDFALFICGVLGRLGGRVRGALVFGFVPRICRGKGSVRIPIDGSFFAAGGAGVTASRAPRTFCTPRARRTAVFFPHRRARRTADTAAAFLLTDEENHRGDKQRRDDPDKNPVDEFHRKRCPMPFTSAAAHHAMTHCMMTTSAARRRDPSSRRMVETAATQGV